MTIHQLLSDLSESGVQIWAEGERLRYRTPRGTLTPAMRAQLSEHRDELLALMRDGNDSASVELLPALMPEPARRSLPFPLTDIQKAYLIGRNEAIELGGVACHAYVEFESADLDLSRLTAAWRYLVQRHDMLRTIIREDGLQQILAQVPDYVIKVLDLRGCSPKEAEAQIEGVRQEMSHQVLPIDQWPLFDIRASRLDDRRTRLHMSLDLLIGDGWSFFLMFREFQDLYERPNVSLQPLDISFRDYVLTEQKLHNTSRYWRCQSYWARRLPTLPPAPELPLALNPASVKPPRFVRRTSKLEAPAWSRLKTRATEAGLTASGVLLAAFAEVLAAWNRHPHLTINVTLFNRLPVHDQVERIMGDFTGTTLLEVHGGDGSFGERARQLQCQLWEDLEHSYISGVKLLRNIARVHGAGLKAMMPVVFTSLLAHTARDARITRGKEAAPWSWLGEMVYGISQTPQVWLDHQVLEEAGSLIFNWDAVEQLFPEGLLDDMFDSYCRFLRQLVHDDAVWEAQVVPLLPSHQLDQQRTVNATDAPIPEGLLHSRCLAQAAQRPDAPAVITTRRTLTYAEVVQRANQIARQVRDWGARPNTLVAVVMEKGWEQVVATLGILEAGAAYLPIDARLPRERLWHLLAQSEATIVLTQSWIEPTIAWPDGLRRLCIDTQVPPAAPLEALAPIQQPDDLAYVIYTSGSTGTPKGVMIDHRGTLNTIVDVNESFHVSPNDRILALSSLSFDLSVYDIFGALVAGAAIVIPDADALRDPAHWAELVARERVTIWNSVPALVEMFVDYAGSRPDLRPLALRLVMMSGDWIPITLPDQIRALVPTIQMISMGGATEASIWSILYPIGTVDPAWKSIPYGKPMRNQQFYVLDDRLELVPTWVPGKLYIGGIGLAKGYWRDEARTSDRFIRHPRTGERLYRTGDLGRYLPDGNIEFLGREDFQVKIQGYRIELGEIEAALQQHEAVTSAVVTVAEAPRGGKQLVAYVVPRCEGDDAQPPTHADADQAPTADEAAPALILDAEERHAFRLRQPSLRADQGRPVIPLAAAPIDEQVIRGYLRRRSYRTFVERPIPLVQFSQFLSCLRNLEINGTPRHRYASAGSLYPVQTYLAIKPGRVEGLGAGIYYYHPKQHALTLLTADAALAPSLHYDSNQAIYDQAAFSIMLIGQMKAIEPLYGSWSRDFCVLEAGYMSQLLMTAGPEFQIGLCPIGSMQFEPIRHLFQLDQGHILLHSLLGGMVEAAEIDIPGVVTTAVAQEVAAAPSTASARGALVDELRGFLKDKLPSYMVPNVFMLLNALPLTSNGKVDRRALPAPTQASDEAESRFVAPRNDDEALLVRLWSTTLGCDAIGVHDNFFELGGNSLSATRLLVQIREQFGVEVPLRHLFEALTIAQMAQVIATLREGPATGSAAPAAAPAHDLRAEVVLDSEIVPEGAPLSPGEAPHSILLTGANGFLGAFLLDQLLRQTPATIYCLVRGSNVEQGAHRLRQALEAYALWDDAFRSRIVAVPGDLALPRLGLDADQFARLAQTVDTVFHNGATVNFMYPYEALKAPNVQGTAEIFRFAGTRRLKPIHLTSSLAVFGAPGSDRPLMCERDVPQSTEGLGNGYAQSKWVAEQLALLARTRGFPVHIYRPGTISGDSRSGAFSQSQFICALIRSCVQVGSAPRLDMRVSMTPVDYVSRAMVYLSQRCSAGPGNTWHLVNPQSISWAALVRWMAESGFPLREVTYAQWQEELRRLARQVPAETLHPLAPLMIDEQLTEAALCGQMHSLHADCRQTLDHLADGLISCPPADVALLRTYFAAFTRDGFLHPAK